MKPKFKAKEKPRFKIGDIVHSNDMHMTLEIMYVHKKFQYYHTVMKSNNDYFKIGMHYPFLISDIDNNYKKINYDYNAIWQGIVK